MISLLKNNTPFAIVILVCLAAMPQFLHHEANLPFHVLVGSTAMQEILSRVMIFLGSGNLLLSKIWSTAVLLSEALLINRIITNQKFTDRSGMLPAVSFLLLNLLLPVNISGLMLVLIGLTIFVIEKLIATYKNPKPNNTLLIAGFFSGLAASLGTPFIMLFLWLTGSLLIMRPASLREWLLTTIGFILPFYFLGSGLYLTDQLQLEKIIPEFIFDVRPPKINQLQWIQILIFIGLPLLTLLLGKNFFNKMMIQNRKSFIIILILYLAMLLICISGLNKLPQLLHLLLIPGSVMFTPLFTSFKRQLIPNLIFWGMVIVSLLR